MTTKSAPHYAGHRQRLKEKLADNSRALADYEIMELVLAAVLPRRDTKPLAKELISHFGSLKGAILARPDQLDSVAGVGPGVQTHWLLLQELYARLGEAQARRGAAFSDPEGRGQSRHCPHGQQGYRGILGPVPGHPQQGHRMETGGPGNGQRHPGLPARDHGLGPAS